MTLLVIGIGNADRGDDAIGLIVARRLATLALPGLAVRECAGDPLDLLHIWAGHATVLLVDAAIGNQPGHIHRLDAAHTKLPVELLPASTHAFGVAQAVELARALHELPAELTIYAIEAGNFAHGTAPDAAVLAAGERVVWEVKARGSAPGPRQRPGAFGNHLLWSSQGGEGLESLGWGL